MPVTIESRGISMVSKSHISKIDTPDTKRGFNKKIRIKHA
jgi:hypothetical protein